MAKIKILTDSCSDLNGELLEKYDIDYARMKTIRGGTETEASLTWEYYTPKELYDLMRRGERITTAQVPPTEFIRLFRKYLDEGFDIIYIGCSLKQSGSVNTGSVVANDILKNYPDRKIACIDSLNSSTGEGMLAIRASMLAAQGKSFEEITDEIMRYRNNVIEYCTVHSLEYLRRAGRVKGASAFFGNLMGVKPIIIADADGVQTPIKKVKGRQNSFEELANLLAENIIEPENQTIYVAHADCSEAEVNALISAIKAKVNCKEIITGYIGPIVGASIGPDAVAVFAFGKEVTYRVGEVD